MRKMLTVLLAALLMLGGGSALADWAPTAACVDAPYDYEYLDADKSIAIRRFEEDGTVFFVCDVQVKFPDGLKAALSHDTPFANDENLTTMAARNGAVLAINGDAYNSHEYGTIIRNGQLIRSAYTTRSLLTVDMLGNMAVKIDRTGEDFENLGQTLLSQGVVQAFEFGPALVENGAACAFSPDFSIIATRDGVLEPRTAIGQIGPLHYIVIVVDGRQDGYSKGINLVGLQQLFVRFGAQTAMNLDGGGSTELWFNGEVINRPSGGKERSLCDIIYF